MRREDVSHKKTTTNKRKEKSNERRRRWMRRRRRSATYGSYELLVNWSLKNFKHQ